MKKDTISYEPIEEVAPEEMGVFMRVLRRLSDTENEALRSVAKSLFNLMARYLYR